MSNKNKGGRPSLYTPDIQKKADEYVNRSFYNKKTINKTFQGAIIPIEVEVPNTVPSVAGLALHLGISRETVYDWCKKHSQFSDTFSNLKLKQEEFLVHHGLLGNYDSGFAKFLAINMTEFKDKVEQTIDHKNIQIVIDDTDNSL